MTKQHFQNWLGRTIAVGLLVAALAPLSWAIDGQLVDGLSRPASWGIPTVQEVRGQVLAYLAEQAPPAAVREQAAKLWPQGETGLSNEQILDRLTETFALFDPRVGELIAWRDAPTELIRPPDADWLLHPSASLVPFAANNLRLAVGRALAQRRLFSESLTFLDGLTAEDVVDPASLLFYQAVGNQRIVELDKSRDALEKLVEREEDLPLRYRTLARLLKVDLEGVQADSLNHIARRMDDVYRRLDLGQAGKTVEMVEEGVVESLDKLIERLEQQQQQQQQQAGAPGSSPNPSQPMPDSQIARLKAPGLVDEKPLGARAGWGDLPPKEREEAMQQIGREFPAHYRDVIEQYFRTLAAGEDGTED